MELRQDEIFERKIEHLKRSYQQMPRLSQVEDIARNIQQAGHHTRRARRPRWMPIAATVTAAVLAGLLIVVSPGIFSGKEEARDSAQNTMELAKDDAGSEESVLIEEEEQSSADEDNDMNTVVPAKERPEEKSDEIEIEGMPETITSKLIFNDELGFSTYYPDNMLAESNGNRLTMIANFGGVRNEDAYIEFVGKATEGDVSEMVNESLSDFDDYSITEKGEDDFWVPFSEREYIILKDDFTGTVSFFERSGMLYRVVIHYPVEYGDGFDPRAAYILGEIMWYDETTNPEQSS